ncbi:MAG: hypothetical protein OES38_10335 [Gammaproteobacteria bacterium]|nr:hypothetical protein [Gammaproteobacteria bacterium]
MTESLRKGWRGRVRLNDIGLIVAIRHPDLQRLTLYGSEGAMRFQPVRANQATARDGLP